MRSPPVAKAITPAKTRRGGKKTAASPVKPETPGSATPAEETKAPGRRVGGRAAAASKTKSKTPSPKKAVAKTPAKAKAKGRGKKVAAAESPAKREAPGRFKVAESCSKINGAIIN